MLWKWESYCTAFKELEKLGLKAGTLNCFQMVSWSVPIPCESFLQSDNMLHMNSSYLFHTSAFQSRYRFLAHQWHISVQMTPLG